MVSLASFIERLFGRQNTTTSKIAKDRLRLVILHDRADLSPAMLGQMRDDLFGVLSKYVDIDRSALEVNLEKIDGSVALIANIPILKIKQQVIDEANKQMLQDTEVVDTAEVVEEEKTLEAAVS